MNEGCVKVSFAEEKFDNLEFLQRRFLSRSSLGQCF
jgi:hypothetical protein